MKNTLQPLRGLLALVLLFNISAQAQTITTFAGTGASGGSGDGGAATAATMTYPHGMAADASGNIYLADANGHRIRMIDPAGIISTIAGTGTAGYNGDGIAAITAQINNPFALSVDALGNIYFCECAGHRVRKIAEGVITTIAGNGTAGFIGDGGPATAARVKSPSGIAVDNSGNVFFSDGGNHRVRKISAGGTITTIGGNGLTPYSGDGVAATTTAIYYPGFLALDFTSGSLYIAENGGDRIRKITTAGIISTHAGLGTATATGDGGPATAAGVRAPGGLAFDSHGNLFLANYGNVVRKISTSGIINMFAGTGASTSAGDGGPAIAASFSSTIGVAIDACDNIYVSEGTGRKIRKIAYDNRTPAFVNGTSITVTVCATTPDTTVIDSAINSLVAVRDTDMCQSDVWSVVTPPSHGTIGGFSHTMPTNGGLLTPTGLSYSPSLSYIGNDTVRISVTDGAMSDTIAIYISVVSCTAPTGLAAVTMAGIPVLSVYPNPGKGAFSIRLNGNTGHRAAAVVLTNIVGAKIQQLTMQAGDEKSISPNLPAGIYLLTAHTEAGTAVCKVIVE